MIHFVIAHVASVTLIVRGRAVKDWFVVTNRITGQAWWQYGAASESAEAAAVKRMTHDQIHRRVADLCTVGVFDTR